MTDQSRLFKTSQLEAADAEPRNATDNPTMGELISARFSRRGFLQGSLAVSAIAATVSPLALLSARDARAQEGGSAFSFTEVEAGIDENHHVAEGYDADILLRWGDGLFPDAPEFDPTTQTAAAQERQIKSRNRTGTSMPAPARRLKRIRRIGRMRRAHAGAREIRGLRNPLQAGPRRYIFFRP